MTGERPSNCLPTASQRLLLNAAFFPEPSALESWEKWISAENLDALPNSCTRILPLIYLNIGKSLKDPELSSLKGIYKRNLYSNHLLIQSVSPAIQKWLDSGIPVMLVKGTPVLFRFYKQFGARLIRDVDVLVPESMRDRAAALIEEMGWKIPDADLKRRPELIAGHWRRLHSVNFWRRDMEHIDLHWFMLELDLRPGTDEGVWRRAQPFRLGRMDVMVPSDTDLLIHLMAHGCNYCASWPSVQAAADLLTIFSGNRAAIDWELLTDELRRRRITQVGHVWFNFLIRHYDIHVPEKVLSLLSRRPSSRLQRLRFNSQFYAPGSPRNVAFRPQNGFIGFATFWRRSVCKAWPVRDDSTGIFSPRRIPDFFTYLQYYFKLRSPWQVPAEALRRLARKGLRLLTREPRTLPRPKSP